MKRTPLKRKTPLRQRGRKALREESALFAFRAEVHARQWCEGNTPACPLGRHPGTDAHHVAPSDRRKGIHNPNRGLLLCREAHAYVHANPQESYERGWLLRAQDGAA